MFVRQNPNPLSVNHSQLLKSCIQFLRYHIGRAQLSNFVLRHKERQQINLDSSCVHDIAPAMTPAGHGSMWNETASIVASPVPDKSASNLRPIRWMAAATW